MSVGVQLLYQPIVVLEEHLEVARAAARRMVPNPAELTDVIAMLGEATTERVA